MLNLKSRRKALTGESRLLLYLEMKDAIEEVRASGACCFSRSSSGCEYWRRPAVNAEANVSRHCKGLLMECADTNVLRKNVGNSQEDIDLRWNGMEKGCLRAFFFNGNGTDEMGIGDGTPSNVQYVQSREGCDRAAESNGSTSSIDCGSGSDIDDLTTFSIAFLINPGSDGEGDEGRILDKGALSVHVSDEADGYLRLTARVQYDTQDALSTTERMIPIGRWSDIAITYDEGGDRLLHLYLDGGEAAYQTQQASQGNRTSDAGNSLHLLNNSAGDRCFDGSLDRFVLWERELSHEEARRLAQEGMAALWNFEDDCRDELGLHHGNPNNVTFTDGENTRAAAFLEADSMVTAPRWPSLWTGNLRRFAARAKIKVPSQPSATASCYLVHKYLAGSGWVFGLYFDGDGMRLWATVKAETANALSESTTKISYGQWHTLAFSYDDFGDRTIRMWADGAEVTYATQDAASGNLYSNVNAELVIGNCSAATDRCLYGYIERLALYRRPLVTAELAGGALLCSSRGNRPVLGASGGSWDSTIVRDPILLMNEQGEVEKVNGQYVLYYTGGGAYLDYRIGRAVSDDGIHWTKSPSDAPVLDVGAAGSWEEKYVSMGTVIKMEDGTYRLYYTGRDDEGNYGLGLATSTDGISFTKHPGNPLIAESEWNATALGVAYVIKLSTGTWALVFEGGPGYKVFLGLSDDGMTWSPANDGDPVMEGDAGEWDSGGVANPKLYELAPGKYLLGYNGQAGENQWDIGFAYSTDLVNWTKFSGNPVLVRGPAEWELARIENAFLAKQEVGTDTVRMWYFGGPDGTHFRIGYATCPQTFMDIFDMIGVTGWQKHVEPNLCEGHSVQLSEAGGADKPFYQNRTLSQGRHIASVLAYRDGGTVSEDDVELYASGEIVNNGGFETDLTGWSGVGSLGGQGSIVRNTAITYGGSAGSCKITHTNQTGRYHAKQTYGDVSLIPGRQYEMKAQVYIPSTNVPSEYVRLETMQGGTDNYHADANLSIHDQWQEVSFQFTAGSATWVAFFCHVSTTNETDGIAYFDNVTLTDVSPRLSTTFDELGGGVYRAWASFAAGSNDFELGAEVKGDKTIYVSLLTCGVVGTSKASGPYPRSPIANDTNGDATRQADSLTVGGSSNFDGGKGTLDVEFYPLFPSSLSGDFELCLAHFYGGSGEIELFRNSPNEVKFRVKANGDEDTVTGTISWSRDDRVKLRVAWDCERTLDETNHMLMYGKVNEGNWAPVGSCSSQPTAPSSEQTLYVGRRGSSAGYEANSFVSWLRIYDRALLDPTW